MASWDFLYLAKGSHLVLLQSQGICLCVFNGSDLERLFVLLCLVYIGGAGAGKGPRRQCLSR